jgi:hypothetical protein
MATAADMDVNALKGLGLSDADIASLAGFDPSRMSLSGIGGVGPLAGAGRYEGETQRFTAPLSNKGNATSTLNRDNIYEVTPGSTVTVVDNATGKVVYSGIGYDAAAKANEVAQGLSDTGGNKATWDIVVDTPGIGSASVAHEKVNLTTTQIGLQVLSVAAQIGVAVATAGASLPAQMAAAGATSAAFTIAQGGSLGDALKAGVMAAVPAAGAKYLGPMINEGLNTASAMVGKAIGAGLSTTTAALLTGQDLGDSIKSGVISGVTTALAPEVKDLFKGAGNASSAGGGSSGGGGGGGGGDIVVTGTGGTAGIGGFSSPTSNAPRPSNTNAQGDIIVTAGSTPGVGIGSLPSSTGSYTNVNIPNEIADLANLPDDTSEIIVNANDYIAGIGGPSAPVGTNTNVDIDADTDIAQDEIIVEGGEETAGIGGPDIPVNTNADVDADTDISQDEIIVEGGEETGGIGGPDIPVGTNTNVDVGGDTDITQDEIIVEGGEETAGIGGGPLSTNMTDIGDLINSDDFQREVAEEEADKDDKSILDIAKDAAQIVGAVATIAGAVTAGGGGGGGGGGDNGPGITFNPTVLTPTVGGPGGAGGVGGAGSRYPYTPTTYGRAGGDQETEYVFFTRAPTTPVAPPAAVPATAGGRKEGGEIHDDMVKHLVEYRKGGGHQGPGKVTGIGSGQEDLIPAWLSDGEYVWSAQDVADLGDGSTDEGVRRLDKMRQMVRKQAGRKDVKKIAKPQKGIDTMLKAVGGQA